jgi:ElaB/YqjD/DUF883 family membrane-anchored ribosome-binding protein
MSPQRTEELSRHYEREAESTRHSLANSLNELNDRLTPGQLFDEVLTYAKSGSGTFARNFSNAVRDNPMPSLLIGAGCMMFLSEKMGITGKAADGGRAIRRVTEGSETMESPSMAETAREKVLRAKDSVKESITAVGDTIRDASQHTRETAEGMRDGVLEAVEQARQGAQSVRRRVTESAVETGEQAMIGGRQVREAARTLMHDQPMVTAGLGLALGAAIAALLPWTRWEDRLMGESSDSIKGKISDAAAEKFETVKQAAGDVVEKAKAVAEREGISSAGTAAAVVRKFAGEETGDGPAAADQMPLEGGAGEQPYRPR